VSKIAIASGASGGHFYPALALARNFRKRFGPEAVLFIIPSGKSRNFVSVLKKEGFPSRMIPAKAAPHGPSIIWASFLARMATSLFYSLWILIEFRPRAVVGFGSFTSAPVVLAAWILRIRTLIHEQNVLLGRANRLTSLFADKVAISFPDTFREASRRLLRKCVYTGNPVRSDILGRNRKEAILRLGLEEGRFTILVMGGSQGAHSINKAITGFLPHMREREGAQFIHLSGRNDFEFVLNEYKRLGVKNKTLAYLDSIGDAYEAADLVIARSGATTIAELTAMGRPSVLVPHPHGDGHQYKNASVLGRKKAAYVLDDNDLSNGALKEVLDSFMQSRDTLEDMRAQSRKLSAPNAAEDLTNEVIKLINT